VLKLVSDENSNADILRGLYRRRPDLDVLRVQDIGLTAAQDAEILAWAAHEGRILLTHDADTMFRWEMVKRFAIAAILLWQVTVWVRWILASVGLGGAS